MCIPFAIFTLALLLQVLTYTWFFLLFAPFTIVLSIDQKALYKVNTDKHKGREYQIMSERARWATVDKGQGWDTICSLALFSVWLLPWLSFAVEAASRSGLQEFADQMKTAAGWNADEHSGERSSMAAALGYVNGGAGIPEEKLEPETATRNMGAVDKFCSLFPEFCVTPEGNFASG